MKSKQITKIFLNGKSIGTKPLNLDDTLTSVRDKIKDKAKVPFIFINKNGKIISNKDEIKLKLKDINEEKNKIINIKEDDSQIKIILDDYIFCYVKCELSQKLNEIRNLINNEKEIDFLFLDTEGYEIIKNDEIDYAVNDILNDKTLKLKTQGDSIQTSNRKINNILKPEINKKIKNIDLSKYKIIVKIKIKK